MKFKFSTIYILSVVAINAAFTYIPSIELPDGTIWSIGSVIAGMVFIARDYAQREVGHKKVILLMVLAGFLSYMASSPYVAAASLLAFAVSELADYMAYTLKGGSFKSRVLASSLISVPVDTVLFLWMIEHISWASFVIMTISKLVAVAVIIARK